MSLVSFLAGVSVGAIGATAAIGSYIVYYGAERIEAIIQRSAWHLLEASVIARDAMEHYTTPPQETRRDNEIYEIEYLDEDLNTIAKDYPQQQYEMAMWDDLLRIHPALHLVKVRYFYHGQMWRVALNRVTIDAWPLRFKEETAARHRYKFLTATGINVDVLNEVLGPDKDFYRHVAPQEVSWWADKESERREAIDNEGEILVFNRFLIL